MKFSLFKKKKPLPDEAQINRGERAEHLLNSVIFNEVMQELEKEFWEQFFSTPTDSYEDRELLYQYMSVLGGIKGKLEQWQGEAVMAREFNLMQGKK